MPKNYFGCAVCIAAASLEYNILMKASIGELALLINRAIRRVNGDYILRSMQTLENLRKKKGVASLEEVHVRHPVNGIIVTNLTRLPIRNLDFGSGAPEDFRTMKD